MELKNLIEIWKAAGEEPDPNRKEKGFDGGFYPPAGIFNWLFNQYSEAISEMQTVIKGIKVDDTPTKNSNNFVSSSGVYTALEERVRTKSINPTKDYVDFVIPLCCLDNTDVAANTHFRGTISLKRDNGSGERVCHIEVVCAKVYDSNNPTYSIRGHIPSNMSVFPARFNHNGKLYFGVYFKNTSSQYNIGSVYGYASHWAVIDCIGVYNYQTSTVLNSEIYNSIEYLESENSVPLVFFNTPKVRNTNGDKTVETHDVYHTGNKPTPAEIGAVPTYKISDYCQEVGWYRVGILKMNATSGSAAATIVVGGQFNNNQTGTYIIGATFSHNNAALQQYVGCGLPDSTTHIRLNRISATEVAVEFYYGRTTANTVHISVQPEMGTFTLLPEVVKLTTETEDVLAVVELLKNARSAMAIEGSYTGTGVKGSANPNSLTFAFQPRFVVVSCGSVTGLFMYAFESARCVDANDNERLTVSWSNDGKTMSWHAKDSETESIGASYQLNSSGQTYRYMAFR